MSPELIAALLGLVGGVIGGLVSGALAGYATIYVYHSQNADLEKDEIRKRKVEVIFTLLGARYVLSANYNMSPEEARMFNTSIALFSVYFSDNKEIMRSYDAFMGDKSNDKLIDLLRQAAKAADFDLLDSTIAKTLTVNPRFHYAMTQATPPE